LNTEYPHVHVTLRGIANGRDLGHLAATSIQQSDRLLVELKVICRFVALNP
jgi:hypothetical protein